MTHLRILITLAAVWGLMAPCMAGKAQELSVKAAVEKSEVFVGESFLFQIQVEGSETPDRPDMSGITDFTVEDLGGQTNSSQSVVIINGDTKRIVKTGYVFNYRLTPTKSGTLTIPSVTVPAGGRRLHTDPVQIDACKPEESEDFKLRQRLSRTECYVGEPITLEVTWYIGREPKHVALSVPLLRDDRFLVGDAEPQADSGEKCYRLPVGNGEALATLGRGTLDGTTYSTLTFRKIVTPKRAGAFHIPAATAACEALMGYQKTERRSMLSDGFFDDFFKDDFFKDSPFGRKGIYKTFVAPSNSLTLNVRNLPESGRPEGFNGLIGRYRVSASAAPTEVSVGDPITLTVRVTGADYLGNVELPPLDKQPALANDFKIPKEMAPGKVEDGAKTFTQTIRATNPEVTEIPPIELPYFDADTGKYSVARTDPIPLRVSPTRVVTAQDAEGRIAPVAAKHELEGRNQGIAHNYEDAGVLVNQQHGPTEWVRSPGWICLIGLPPLTYFVLLVSTTVIRRRAADPAGLRARRAYGDLTRRVKAIRRRRTQQSDDLYIDILEALKDYLGGKLHLSGGALTFVDAKRALKDRGVDPDTLDMLGKVFAECEAGRYAGGASATDEPATIAQRVLDLSKKLERNLK